MRGKFKKIKKAAAAAALTAGVAAGLAAFTLSAAALETGRIISPVDGSTTESLEIKAEWVPPIGATQYQIRIVPKNNDGPGINLIRNISSFYSISAPVIGTSLEDLLLRINYGNFVMLPRGEYSLELRFSGANSAIGENDPSWGQWTKTAFRTPGFTSQSIAPVVWPNVNGRTSTTPIISMTDTNQNAFYYEVQVSSDQKFGEENPIAPVYHMLIHAGQTSPIGSWTVPQQFALENGRDYYIRWRHRTQMDGIPEAWSNALKVTADETILNSMSPLELSVFHDINGDGVNQAEPATNDALVKLTHESGMFWIGSTNINGNLIANLPQGKYRVDVYGKAKSGEPFLYITPSLKEVKPLRKGLEILLGTDSKVNVPLAEGFLTLAFDESICNEEYPYIKGHGLCNPLATQDLKKGPGVLDYLGRVLTSWGRLIGGIAIFERAGPYEEHEGSDYGIRKGTVVKAAAPGKLSLVGDDIVGIITTIEPYFMGKGESYSVLYQHCTPVVQTIPGQTVWIDRGTPICLSGEAGGFPHLHFAVDNKGPISPYKSADGSHRNLWIHFNLENLPKVYMLKR